LRSKTRLLGAGLTAALLLLLSEAAPARAQSGGWVSARSQNFLVVSEAGEAEARAAARQLEQYRAAFARVFPREHFEPSAPTTVVLFRDQKSYAPFKPLFDGREAADVAGYFQPGLEVNYITLAADADRARDPSSTLLHEYVHLLVDNYFRHAPLWLKEGLAEFYSTARLSPDGRRLALGAPPRQRAQTLRAARALMPLAALFNIDAHSPQYFEPGRRSLFYAQSWALVHYLSGEGGAGRARVTRYLELLAAGEEGGAAFARAFGAGARELEGPLAAYVRGAEFRERAETLTPAVEFDAGAQVRPLARAEVLARLGDLLLRAERADEAEPYLLQAAGLDGGLGAAHLSLGVLRLRQSRFAEAKEHLRKAVAADPQNYLARFHLADALHREGLGMSETDVSVAGFEEKTRLVREELRRAVELAPDFLESYRLLAVVELDRAGRAGEAAALLAEALRRAPRRQDFTLLLAQVRLSEGEFDAARAEAGRVARGGDASLRWQAKQLLEQIEARAARAARLRETDAEAARLEAMARVPTLPCDMPEPGPQQKRLRFAGEQACGRLVQIECGDGDGVVLHVETGARLLRLRAEAINRIRFVTYTESVKAAGRVACGPRDPANFVLVTFRPRRADPSGLDGDASAVEFIPPDWSR
jgi:tetratricopeptide (TPR) repeat protein